MEERVGKEELAADADREGGGVPTWTGGATRAGVKGGRRWALYRRASGAGVSTTGVPGSVRGGSNHYNPSARLIWSPQNSYLGDVFLGDAVVSVVW